MLKNPIELESFEWSGSGNFVAIQSASDAIRSSLFQLIAHFLHCNIFSRSRFFKLADRVYALSLIYFYLIYFKRIIAMLLK